jgi:hypothetical protein
MPYAINRIPNNSYRVGRRTTTLKKNTHSIPLEPIPPVAFLMMGHGSEDVEYKTVPKGCILVVPTKSGEAVMQRNLSPNQLKFLDSANRTAILDPVGHKAELYKLFGPVSIFTEGEQYPDFVYTLLSYFSSKPYINSKSDMPRKSIPIIALSGLVKLEGDTPANPDLIESIRVISSGPEYFKQGSKEGVIKPLRLNPKILDVPLLLTNKKIPELSIIQTMSTSDRNKAFKNTMTVLNPQAAKIIKELDIPQMFKFSNDDYINSKWIEENIQLDLEEYSKEGPRPASLGLTIGDYIGDILTEPLEFSQEFLFENCGPGVYYNFICRSMLSDFSEANPFQLTTAALHGISEAETRRKMVVRNGQGQGRRRRRQNQRVSAKTRKRKTRV